MTNYTYSDGASQERECIRNKVERMQKECRHPHVHVALGQLLFWINTRVKRYSKKPGGLGPKSKPRPPLTTRKRK